MGILTLEDELKFVPGGTGGLSVVGALIGMIINMCQYSLMQMLVLYADS